MILTEQELEIERKKELVRREGNQFIRVKWAGEPRTVEQLRIHGLKDIKTDMVPDMEHPGRTKMVAREIFAPTLFHEDIVSGELYCEIWDDPEDHNRFWISRCPDLYVIDDVLRKEIKSLIDKPYTTELNEEELLLREKRKIERRLNELTGGKNYEEEKEIQSSHQRAPVKKRATRRRRSRIIKPKVTQQETANASDNKSDMYVGGTGMPGMDKGGAERIEGVSESGPYNTSGI